MKRCCALCRKDETSGELRGVKHRGIPAGVYHESCFQLGAPGKAYLRWEHAMTLAEYASYENSKHWRE